MKPYFSPKIITIFFVSLIFTGKINAQDESLLPQIDSSSGKSKVELLNKYAASFISKRPLKRLNISRQALNEARKINYKKGIADALNNCGISSYYMHQYGEALKKYNKAFPLFVENGDSTAIGGIYNNIANVYQKMGIIDSSEKYNKLALAVREKLNSFSGMATSITNLGLLSLTRGDYPEALVHFQRALELRRKEGRDLSIASSLNSIGALYWKWGNLNSALEYYEKALALNQSGDHKYGIIITKLNIGLINIDLGAYDFAEKYINSAIDEAGKNDMEKGKANGYYYLAILKNKQVKLKSSLQILVKSFPYFEKINDYSALSKLYTLKAQNHLGLKNISAAEKSVKMALEEAYKVDDSSLVAAALQVISEIELRKNNFKGALLTTAKSLEINKHKHHLEKELEDYKQLTKIQLKMGDYKSAVKSMELYNALNDSLFNKKLSGNIANWRVKFETAKKENQILKLNKENAFHLSELSKQKTLRNLFIAVSILGVSLLIILYYFYSHHKKTNKLISGKNIQLDELNSCLEEQNKQLVKTNNTKDKLFSIIAHDLKGPFNSLLGFTQMLDEDMKKLSDEEIIQITKYIHEASNRLFKLTKNLLDWARLQIDAINPKPEKLNVEHFITEFMETIKPAASEKGISLNIKIDDEVSVYTDPQILDTVLRNLIANSIKYTNNGGIVNLIVNSGKDKTIFIVKDNGVGIEPNNLRQIFNEEEFYSTNGTEGEKGTGLGLKICKELIEMSGGRLKGESKLGDGTEFSFTLPTSHQAVVQPQIV